MFFLIGAIEICDDDDDDDDDELCLRGFPYLHC